MTKNTNLLKTQKLKRFSTQVVFDALRFRIEHNYIHLYSPFLVDNTEMNRQTDSIQTKCTKLLQNTYTYTCISLLYKHSAHIYIGLYIQVRVIIFSVKYIAHPLTTFYREKAKKSKMAKFGKSLSFQVLYFLNESSI